MVGVYWRKGGKEGEERERRRVILVESRAYKNTVLKGQGFEELEGFA